eukprot:scaffold42123_cov221-Amphora_coffeaeformis.AAC.3
MSSSSTSSSNMPVWADDSHMDTEWLLAKTKIPCASPKKLVVSARDISTNQGRVGSIPREGGTLLLSLVGDDNDIGRDETTPRELVLKQITPGPAAALSRQLGLAREAFFYRDLAPCLHVGSSSEGPLLLPNIYYAHADAGTGEKCIIMESLSDWIDSGIVFGPNPETGFRSNPNNWAPRNLPALIAKAYDQRPVPSPRTVAQRTFQSVAQIHASFWQDKSLLDDSKQWLRGQAWIQGRGKESWEASQSLIQHIWEEYSNNPKQRDDSTKDIQWDPVVREAVDKCIQGISWQAQLDRLHVDGHFTLVHGDFWPGNIMWDPTNDHSGNFRILDWEMVGLGSGPQDLGQYVLSNMDPADRRVCERDLVQAYYDELVRCGVSPTNHYEDDSETTDLWEYCWKEYRIGGVERWLWFLVWFLGQPTLREWTQFFHDQISEMMKDHNLTAADLTQPRP